MNKKIYVIVMFMVCLKFSAATQTIPILSKEEMHKDFDALLCFIKDANPQLEIRRQVTGIDILEKIKQLRTHIDTITDFSSYYKLVCFALHLTQDGHNHLMNGCSFCDSDNIYITDTTKTISELCMSKGWKFSKRHFMGVKYINGSYYFVQNLTTDDEDETVFFEKGSKVLQINGMDIDSYVIKIGETLGSPLRWDAVRKKLYTPAVYVDRKDTITITVEMLDKEIKDINIISGETFLYYRGRMNTDSEEPKVLYFQNANVLYVRIPDMDTKLIPFYNEKISNFRNQKINKVVVDIRGNGGGNDNVWRNVLSAIVDKPLTWKTKILFRKTPVVTSYLHEIRGDSLPLINYNNLNINRDTFFYKYNDELDTIMPFQNTIAYSGNIYVIADERCYSSAKAFTSVCEKIDRLVSIGQPIGNIGGEGLNPFVFSLPFSKLIFRLGSVVEGVYSDSNNIEDYYHDTLEIPIELTVEKVIFRENWTKQLYDEEYLFKYDDAFKKILEL